MRAKALIFCLLLAGCPLLSARAGSPRVVKVLPQFLDREGRSSVSPSLFDRDAYQFRLRHHPEERSGIRFAIQWKGPRGAASRLRVELRGARGQEPTTAMIEESAEGRGVFSSWTSLRLSGESYRQFGELVAWRVTLWNAGQQVSERTSYLW